MNQKDKIKIKKRKYILLSIFVLLIIFIIINILNQNNKSNDLNQTQTQKIVLGYCPTMYEYARNIQELNDNLELRLFESSLTAINQLKSGNLDIILIGRIAKLNELNNAYELRLRQGMTLVSINKNFILEQDLINIPIHTALSREIVELYFPITNNIIFHDSLDYAIRNGIHQSVLIDWNDFNDDFELLIPVDAQMNKIEKFRLPILYSLDKDLIDNLVFE
jgi:hypothetical protein